MDLIDEFLWKQSFTALHWLGSFVHNVCGVDLNTEKTPIATYGKPFHSEATVVTKEYRTFERHLTQLTTNPCPNDTKTHARHVFTHTPCRHRERSIAYIGILSYNGTYFVWCPGRPCRILNNAARLSALKFNFLYTSTMLCQLAHV
jgi:hypothetical protein